MHIYKPNAQPGEPPVLVTEKEYICLRFGGRNRICQSPETFEDAEVQARQIFPALANKAFVFETDALPISCGAVVEVHEDCWQDLRPALRQLDIRILDDAEPRREPRAAIPTPPTIAPVGALNATPAIRISLPHPVTPKVGDALSRSAQILSKASPVVGPGRSSTSNTLYQTPSHALNSPGQAGPSRTSNIFANSPTPDREPSPPNRSMSVDRPNEATNSAPTLEERETSPPSDADKKRKRDPSEEQEEVAPRRRAPTSSWPVGFEATPDVIVPARHEPAVRVSNSPLPSFSGSKREPPSPTSAPPSPAIKQERVVKTEPQAGSSKAEASGTSRSQPAPPEPRSDDSARRTSQARPTQSDDKFVIRVYPPGGPEYGKHKAFKVKPSFTIAKVLATACKSFGYLTPDGEPVCSLSQYIEDGPDGDIHLMPCNPEETVGQTGARDKSEFELALLEHLDEDESY